jgi:tRNA A37 methylthiotransferase MiaB
VRSNFIVGFPGETAEDLRELELFLSEARLDAIGIFGYSDEDGTEAAGFAESDKLDSGEVARRVSEFAGLAEEIMTQRAADRIGDTVEVLVEETVLAADGSGEGRYEGRAAHQAPDVDGSTTLLSSRPLRPGDLVSAQVVDSVGADLIARA